MKVAIGQITSKASLIENGQMVAKLIEKAFNSGCKILFLPEASDYIATSPQQSIELAQPVHKSPFLSEIRKALKQFPLFISVGVHEPSESSNITQQQTGIKSKIRNTLLWMDPNGFILNRYQKIHLFDLDLPHMQLKESNSVEKGLLHPDLFDYNGLKFGPQICYDIRFPESALYLRALGADVLVYPSAFTVKTGEAHWRVLNQSRAIDTQCFVLSAAQIGQHDLEGKRVSYGHAIAVDPWGRILAEAKDNEDMITVDLDLALLKQVRTSMPLLEHRNSTKLFKSIF